MLKDSILNLAKRIIGKKNIALRQIISREYKSGHYIRAVGLMIYLFPVKSKLSEERVYHKYAFVTSSEYYHDIWELLHISKTRGYELIRLGRDNDGGYIMLNDFGNDDKIAYSFGISSDVSWDKDMASRDYEVFMYDHTIEGLPESNSHFHWFKLGIFDGSTNDDRLKTLEYLIEQNHHQGKQDMILKMDVEGAEWGFLESVKTETLNRFSQILFEFHGINKPNLCRRITSALRKLNQTHKLIHLHGMNAGYYISNGGKVFCNQIEVLYVRRDKYSFIEDYDVELPINIDMPASKWSEDVVLGHWNDEFKADNNNFSMMSADDNHVSIITV